MHFKLLRLLRICQVIDDSPRTKSWNLWTGRDMGPLSPTVSRPWNPRESFFESFRHPATSISTSRSWLWDTLLLQSLVVILGRRLRIQRVIWPWPLEVVTKPNSIKFVHWLWKFTLDSFSRNPPIAVITIVQETFCRDSSGHSLAASCLKTSGRIGISLIIIPLLLFKLNAASIKVFSWNVEPCPWWAWSYWLLERVHHLQPVCILFCPCGKV